MEMILNRLSQFYIQHVKPGITEQISTQEDQMQLEMAVEEILEE